MADLPSVPERLRPRPPSPARLPESDSDRAFPARREGSPPGEPDLAGGAPRNPRPGGGPGYRRTHAEASTSELFDSVFSLCSGKRWPDGIGGGSRGLSALAQDVVSVRGSGVYDRRRWPLYDVLRAAESTEAEDYAWEVAARLVALSTGSLEGRRQGLGADHLLEERAAHAARARRVLIESYVGYALRTARTYVGRGVPFLDLVQEGVTGVAEAVDRYDPAGPTVQAGRGDVGLAEDREGRRHLRPDGPASAQRPPAALEGGTGVRALPPLGRGLAPRPGRLGLWSARLGSPDTPGGRLERRRDAVTGACARGWAGARQDHRVLGIQEPSPGAVLRPS